MSKKILWLLLIGIVALAAVGSLLYLRRRPKLTDSSVAKQLNIDVQDVERLHKTLGLSNAVLVSATPQQLQEALIQSRYPDLPSAREQFRFWQLQSETGRI